MSKFRFLRAFIESGGVCSPSFVTLNNKNYTFCGAYRLGNSMVYKYSFDNLPIVEFTVYKSEFDRIRRLGDKYQDRLGKLHPIYFI